MSKVLLKCSLAWLLLLSSFTLYAAQKDPIEFLQGISNAVMHELTKNRAAIAADPEKVYPLIQRLIVPSVDFVEMGTWIAGRRAWAESSPEQRNAFIEQFKFLVVKTYGSALVGYSDDKISFPPQACDLTKERIEIMSWVKRRSSEDVRVKYRLIKRGTSWKVYDLEVEGVSILRGFMAQFSNEIKAQGLSVVIKQMKEHNGNR